jgi:hypothetical protein
MPAARQSRLTLTGTRVPAITAWPCITRGSAETRPTGMKGWSGNAGAAAQHAPLCCGGVTRPPAEQIEG